METLAASIAALRPRFGGADACRIARELWGLTATARELPSERDQNYLLTDESSERFVLKISNASERREVLELQVAAMEHLSLADLPYGFPAARPTMDGRVIASIEALGESYLVRLLSFVPGHPLDVKTCSPGVLHELGRFIGSLDRSLTDFSHPSADRSLVWDLTSAASLIREHLSAVDDLPSRELVERHLDRYDRWSAPVLDDLRRSVIHNDANDANLLVEPWTPDGVKDGASLIAGLIDFGDMVRSWTVADLAVVCAYAAMDTTDPVGVCARIANGYHSAFPLLEPEADVLFDLIRLRLCLSAVICAVRQAHEPENQYLGVSEGQAWGLLHRLDTDGDVDLPRYRLRHACGLTPCPAGGHLARWLARGGHDAAPVVSTDSAAADPIVFDLSVESPDGGEVEDPGDMEEWTRTLFRQLEDAGGDLAIGRYDEVRWCYVGPAFRTDADGRAEWRTVHVGIDLFQEPGSPIFAPLPGVVHSFADNADRLDYGPTLILEHEIPEEPIRFWSLYGHMSADSLEGLETGRRFEKGEVVGRIGDRPGNGDWPPHLHFQLIADLLGQEGTFPGVAAPSQREVWLSVSPDPNLLLGIRGETRVPRPAPRDSLVGQRTRRLGPSLSLSYRLPLHIVRGRGAYLYDVDGQPFLDCVNNVAHVGHCHPRVVAAERRQAGVLNTNTRYLHEAILEYAERLTALLPDPLSVCFFVCSGSEANELALRMARAHTGGEDVITVEGAYHGNTAALIGISPYKFEGAGGEGPPPHVHVVPMPDLYRGRYRSDDPDAVRKYAAHVREAAGLASGLDAEAGGVAGLSAFICESLLGCGGQIPLPEGYLAQACQSVREAGGVCIADEVQVGFGRVGEHFWGFEAQGVVPDIVTLGKPIGNGHPVAVVVTTPEIAASFATGMEYFNTFGGNPVSCEVALAVLEVIQAEGLQDHARRVGENLRVGLGSLMGHHDIIGDVRGLGLFLGVELVLDRETRAPAAAHASFAVDRMREEGILLSTDGPDHNVIKIKPPLVFSEADADLLTNTLDRVLTEDAFRL